MYRSIIVPIDGSARSHGALPVAASLAQSSGATLELARVHVEERPDLADDPSWEEMFRDGEQRYLESLALAYQAMAGGQVRTVLLEGKSVVDTLSAFATSRVAPLVVIAARGRTGLRRALLGSVSDGLVRNGSAPVLILRDRPSDSDTPLWKLRGQPFRRIVVPLDGTAFAEASLPHAVAIAAATRASLHLVRVIGPVMNAAIVGAMAMHPPGTDQLTVVRNDLAEEYLQQVVDRISAWGGNMKITTEVALSLETGAAIVESCNRHVADLIVMATHGRGASRLLVSAVGDRVLRDGPDAALFIRPDADRRPAALTIPDSDHAAHEPAIDDAEHPFTVVH